MLTNRQSPYSLGSAAVGAANGGSNDYSQIAQQLSKMMQAGGWGSIGSGLLGLLFPGENPASAAGDYYNQIPDQLRQYLDPYMQAGKDTLPQLQQQYKDLMADPGSLLSRLGQGYQKSPGYEFERNEGLNSINNAAAAGGMLGTQQHQRNAADYSTNFANRDFNQYLNNALGLWGKGLSGQEGINQMGFEASKSLAEDIAQALMSQGNLAYSGQAGENSAMGDIFSNLAGGAAALAFL